jgi:HK97 family phage major capsid protein
VPQVLAERIVDVARDRSNIRAIASVVQITGSAYELPVDPNDLDANWVSEHGSRPETSTPQLAKITIPVHEIYANPKATQTILDDSAVNIEEWLSGRVRDIFDRKENAAFVNGDGVGKPHGFLQYPKIADASWAWGSIGYIATGGTDFSPDPDAADDFIDTVYALKTDYRAGARWVMNSKTAARVRDSDDNYLWIQSIVAGQPSTLLGYPVVIAEDMPDVEDGAYPVAFGNFLRGYTVVDRVGVRVLRDPFTAKPYVMFYTTKRVGGGVIDFDAIKLIKTAAS